MNNNMNQMNSINNQINNNNFNQMNNNKLLHKVKMAEIIFIYEGNQINIQCDKNQKMYEICNKLISKININLNSLIFLYGGNQLNLDKKLNEITKENKINILVFKKENENEICSQSGRILNDKIIDNIILLNNNINMTLLGLKSQIENIINDLINKKDNMYINSQLKNVNILINNILNEDIKKINNELNKIKNNDYITNIRENKKDELKNEIICIYNKQDNEINLLHDYNNLEDWDEQYKKLYLEGKNNINEKNIEIYINDKKIEFVYKYKSNEKGNIKVIFKFNKLLTSTNSMFYKCSSLESINLSSFNTSNVNNMSYMFSKCSSLESINLSLFNTSKVNNMSYMFFGCSSLKSIDLSSFNTSNVNDMSWMFWDCSSLKSIDLSSFNTSNVYDMSSMFNNCYSLESIDLSSFNISNVNNMSCMLYDCSSLKKEKIKINESNKRILDELF